jgi:hypothetical protein
MSRYIRVGAILPSGRLSLTSGDVLKELLASVQMAVFEWWSRDDVGG